MDHRRSAWSKKKNTFYCSFVRITLGDYIGGLHWRTAGGLHQDYIGGLNRKDYRIILEDCIGRLQEDCTDYIGGLNRKDYRIILEG